MLKNMLPQTLVRARPPRTPDPPPPPKVFFGTPTHPTTGSGEAADDGGQARVELTHALAVTPHAGEPRQGIPGAGLDELGQAVALVQDFLELRQKGRRLHIRRCGYNNKKKRESESSFLFFFVGGAVFTLCGICRLTQVYTRGRSGC